jgi:hypothetical protein
MLTALTEGSEADLTGYTDEAINVTSELLERVGTVGRVVDDLGRVARAETPQINRLRHLEDMADSLHRLPSAPEDLSSHHSTLQSGSTFSRSILRNPQYL